jgi:hypothetical protein
MESNTAAASLHERSDVPNIHRNEEYRSDSQEGILFDRYQRLMAPYMAFVVIPIGTHVSSLAETKPLLLQAIITVTSFNDTAIQQSMAKDLMRQLSERILINCEKSLDILQGLLVFM